MGIATNAPLLMKLWGIPFVLVGLYIIFGRFFFKKKKKQKTLYAVTNKRILIVNTLWKINITSMFIKDLPEINKSINKKGLGNIVFGSNNYGTEIYANSGFNIFSNKRGGIPLGFYDIWDAEEVYKKIVKIKNEN